MEQDATRAKQSIEKDINAYRKLKNIPNHEGMNDFLDMLLKTAAEKMVWSFLEGNVKSYEDFIKVRAEVTSYLYGIQEVRGADAMVKHLEQQLKQYYNPEA